MVVNKYREKWNALPERMVTHNKRGSTLVTFFIFILF